MNESMSEKCMYEAYLHRSSCEPEIDALRVGHFNGRKKVVPGSRERSSWLIISIQITELESILVVE